MSDQLEARAAITDLVHTYAAHVRAGNGAACIELFTTDAEFEVREAYIGRDAAPRTRSKLTGRAAIANYLARTAAPETRVCPLIHNLLIEVNDREATSTCVMVSLVWSSGRQIVGEYSDSYLKEDGWRFVSRICTIRGEFLLQRAEPHQR
jgi:hypothetical protein